MQVALFYLAKLPLIQLILSRSAQADAEKLLARL